MKEKKVIINLTYNQYIKLYQGAQFLKIKRNNKTYYINYYRHLGEYVATNFLGITYDNVKVISY